MLCRKVSGERQKKRIIDTVRECFCSAFNNTMAKILDIVEKRSLVIPPVKTLNDSLLHKGGYRHRWWHFTVWLHSYSTVNQQRSVLWKRPRAWENVISCVRKESLCMRNGLSESEGCLWMAEGWLLKKAYWPPHENNGIKDVKRTVPCKGWVHAV